MAEKKRTHIKSTDLKDENGLWIRSIQKDSVKLYTKSGALWGSINARVGKHASYLTCRNLFSDYQAFADWCHNEPNYLNKEVDGSYWPIDKDIIVPLNTDYSEETCCFVPQSLNKLLLYRGAAKGDFPLGVYNDRGFYRAQAAVGTKAEGNISRKYLGRSLYPMEAHQLWQAHKIEEILKAVDNFNYLPEKVLQGLYQHAMIIQSDLDNGTETVRQILIPPDSGASK